MNGARRHGYTVVAVVFLLIVAAGCSEDQPGGTPTSVDDLALENRGGRGGRDGRDDDDRNLRGSTPFSDVEIFFEYNSSADDAGIQVFLDADAWKEIAIFDENGRDLLEIETGGGMKKLGLTELRFEGAEPGGLEALGAFPEGEYRFRGITIDRMRLVGSADLSHDLPPAPEFTPSEGETVDPDDVVIEWEPIPGMDRFQVIVESDANGLVMEVSVSPQTTSLHVPPTFLVPNTEYKAEVLAISPDGNRTITEGTFVTGP
jgi:hypothetical protein